MYVFQAVHLRHSVEKALNTIKLKILHSHELLLSCTLIIEMMNNKYIVVKSIKIILFSLILFIYMIYPICKIKNSFRIVKLDASEIFHYFSSKNNVRSTKEIR